MSDVSISIGVEGKSQSISAFSEIEAAGKKMAEKFGEMAKKVGELYLSFEALKKVAETFNKVLEEGSRLTEFSEQTGIAKEQLVLLQRSFEMNGLSADVLGKSVNKMQKSLAEAGSDGSKTAEKLNSLGISVNALRAMSPDKQFEEISKQISSIPDPTMRAEAAMTLFGKSGGAMLPVMQNLGESLETAKGQIGTFAEIMSRNGDLFHLLKNNIDEIGRKFMEFASGILDRVSPAITALTEKLTGIDAAKIGQKLGDGFLKFADTVTGFFSGNWQDMMDNAWTFFEAGGKTVLDNMLGSLETVVEFAKNLFKEVLGTSYWSNIATMFKDSMLLASMVVYEKILSLTDQIWSFFSSVSTSTWKHLISNVGSWYFDMIKQVALAEMNAILHPLDTAKKVFHAVFGEASQDAEEAYSKAGGNLFHKLDAATKAGITKLTSDLQKATGEAGTALGSSLKKAISQTHLIKSNFFGGAEAMAKATALAGKLAAEGAAWRKNMEKGSKAVQEALGGGKEGTGATPEAGPSATYSPVMTGPTVALQNLNGGVFKNIENLPLEIQNELAAFSAQLTGGVISQQSRSRAGYFEKYNQFDAATNVKQAEMERENTLALEKLAAVLGGPKGKAGAGGSSTLSKYLNNPTGSLKGEATEKKTDPMELVSKTLDSILTVLGKSLGTDVSAISKALPQAVLV